MMDLGLGGCLLAESAHDRRLDALALIASVRDERATQARVPVAGASAVRSQGSPPPLVICAAASLPLWKAEIARFAPALAPARHEGSGRSRSAADLAERAAGRGLVLASYEALVVDVGLFEALPWPVVLFDNAEALADATSLEAAASRRLRAGVRFALAGSPLRMERRLDDVCALLDLVSPGLLGPLDALQREITRPLERFRDPEAEALFAKLVRPFIYRPNANEPEPSSAEPPRARVTRRGGTP
jgi:SNF2 family DNA or RNA helicase